MAVWTLELVDLDGDGNNLTIDADQENLSIVPTGVEVRIESGRSFRLIPWRRINEIRGTVPQESEIVVPEIDLSKLRELRG